MSQAGDQGNFQSRWYTVANPVRPYEHETSTSLIELNAVETKGVATAQPLAPYAFVCHTAAWPLSPRQILQLTSRVGKHSTAAAWPLFPRQFQQLASRVGKRSTAAAWSLSSRQFQQLTSRVGKRSTAAAWSLSPRQFQQLTSHVGKHSTAAAWPLSSAVSAANLSRRDCSLASLSSADSAASLSRWEALD